MHPVADHPVPAGPLAVRWLAWTLDRPRAGALSRARVVLENAGAAAWSDIKLGYHWLDRLGNAIVWDGLRTDLPALSPGMRAEVHATVRSPLPPGEYRLAFDLVREYGYWLSELGNVSLDLDVQVEPRDAAHAVVHLTDDVEAPGDWHARVRALHEEGFAAVGGAVERVSGYEPGPGRKPGFDLPLVCPSLLPPLEPNGEVAGLPAWTPEGDEPWVYDASIVARRRS